MIVALWAALTMLVQDILCVLLVQAESRDKAGLTAALDCVMWLASIATTAITVTALQGDSPALKAVVIVAVTIGNIMGSIIGIKLGRRFIKDHDAIARDAELKRLREAVERLTGCQDCPYRREHE